MRGRCAPLYRMSTGAESVYADLTSGDLFGEISVLLGKPASATVRTTTPCALLFLEKEAALSFLKGEPGIKARLTQLNA